LAAQETRILEAYRLEVLTPDQLSRELATIAERRKSLEKQSLTDSSTQAQTLQPPIKRLCDGMASRLSNLTFETKRTILRELIRKIVYEGEQVRIVGIIPLAEAGEIAPTRTHLYGHNAPATIPFMFAAPVVRDPARFRAACASNLRKANEVLAGKRRAELRRE
jgi:hypothetical protein